MLSEECEVIAPQKDKPKKRRRTVAKVVGIILAAVLLVTGGMVVKVLVVESPAQHSLAEYQAMYPATEIALTADGSLTVRPSGDGPQTGIVFYTGAQIPPVAYTPIMGKLAERGYTCFVPKLFGNMALFDSDAAADIVTQNPAIEKWYVGGHSMGGLVGSGYAADNLDKMDGLFFLAAYTGADLSEADLPLLSLYGDCDTVLNFSNYNGQAPKLPADFEEHVIAGGNHGHFGDYGEQLHDSPSTITPEEQWEQSAALIDDWIARHGGSAD